MENLLQYNFICTNCLQENTLSSKGFICTKCNYINAVPENIDYFSYFGIEKALPINQEILEDKLMSLMQLYHTDNFVNCDNAQQQNSLHQTSFLNEAYSYLSNKKLALSYLYKLIHKEPIVEEGVVSESNNSLVMEFFDLFSRMQTLKTSEEAEGFKGEVSAAIEVLYNKVYQLSLIEHKQEIKDLYSRIQYLTRILERVPKL